MLQARADARAILGRLEVASWRKAWIAAACLALAAAVAWLPELEGLSPAGRRALFILVAAAGLWVTEAIPAFAVALVAVGLEIALLGRPGGAFAQGPDDWQIFVAPWASPLIWLFFGGFVLAEAAGRTGVDRWLSGRILSRFGTRPGAVLAGSMAVTFLFSMFVSNTATAAMMLAILGPVAVSLAPGDRFAKALLLSVPIAANLGGMGTLIGTPPNAIAAGALALTEPLPFLRWMAAGLPPALALSGIAWLYLTRRYPASGDRLDLSAIGRPVEAPLPRWQRLLVIAVFVLTVVLWMTGPLHGLPTPVVSFLPLCVLTAAGVLRAEHIRRLHWEVLLMMFGGLSLGVAVTETGLAAWIVDLLPAAGEGALLLLFGLAYVTALLSNFMSNTAAANILIPIAAALVASGSEEPAAAFVVPIALAASAAMALPVSTPPNAIAFASGRLAARDFLETGLLMGALAPAVAVLWCRLIFRVV